MAFLKPTNKTIALLFLILICMVIDILTSHFEMITGTNITNHISNVSNKTNVNSLKSDISQLNVIIKNQTLAYQKLNAQYNADISNNKYNSQIPKIIWILWFQGWSHAPIIPRNALKSWKYFNTPNWIIITLDDTNLPFYVSSYNYYKGLIFDTFSEFEPKRYATLSDIIRLELLNTYGGVWVDSTVFCTQPLNEWLFDYVNNNGFFAFKFNNRKHGILSSWFLSTSFNHSYIIKQWINHTYIYWKPYSLIAINSTEYNKTLDHFWVFGIFKKLLKSDEKFRRNWENMKQFSVKEPHMLRHTIYRMTQSNISNDIKKHIDNRKSPMYKLDHRIISYKVNSIVGYLFKTYDFINDQ
eukprot:211883_1